MHDARIAGHPVELVRHPRARAFRLGIDPRSGAIRLTIPRRGSAAQALAWAHGKSAWVARQLERLPRPQPIVPGMTVPFAGRALTLDWSAERSRTIRIEAARLIAGGPREMLAQRVLRWLRREAGRLLESESRALAAAHEITLGRVGVGDPASRWGSCAASGDIRYSWRLVLAPDFVRRATVAHEVAHRVHMNHGPAFHALVAELLGDDPRPAGDWLRHHGATLHWFGRDS